MSIEYKLFVKNIPFNCAEDEIVTFMKNIKGVKDVSIKFVTFNGRIVNKGFGIITFDSQETCEATKNDTYVYAGRTLKFKDYVNQNKSYNIHVMNVLEEMKEQEIFDVFSKFGKVDSVRKDINSYTGKFKGTAVVTMTNYEDFSKVLSEKSISIGEHNVDVVKRKFRPRMQQQNVRYIEYRPRYVPNKFNERNIGNDGKRNN